MATKLYRFNPRRTYARVILKGESGNEVIYEFVNGNPIASIPARCLLRGQYEQELLEKSDLVKNKIVSLEKVTESEDEVAAREKAEAERKAKEDKMEKVDDVVSVMDAINYVAEHFDEKAKNAREAKDIAYKNGVLFPNLRKTK